MNLYQARPPLVADERTQLIGWLDLQRALVRRKLEGLRAEDEHRAVLPDSPMMTPAGLVSHMRWTEHCWFNVIFLGESEDSNPQFDKSAPIDSEWMVDNVPLARLLDGFEAQCAQSNEITAAHSLDDVGKQPDFTPDAAVDHDPHGRGDRPARRAPGHGARAPGRPEGVLLARLRSPRSKARDLHSASPWAVELARLGRLGHECVNRSRAVAQSQFAPPKRILGTHKQRPYAQASCAAGDNPIGAPEV